MQRDSDTYRTQHQRLFCCRAYRNWPIALSKAFGGDHQIKLFRQSGFIFDLTSSPNCAFDQRPRDLRPGMPLNCFHLSGAPATLKYAYRLYVTNIVIGQSFKVSMPFVALHIDHRVFKRRLTPPLRFHQHAVRFAARRCPRETHQSRCRERQRRRP